MLMLILIIFSCYLADQEIYDDVAGMSRVYPGSSILTGVSCNSTGLKHWAN
jgi:hypothetical protein